MHAVDRVADCDFSGPDAICPFCGFAGEAGARRNCKERPKPSLCIHRGGQLRQEKCQTCQGEVRVKVFSCALHGECTLSNKLPNVRFCGACPDVELADPGPAERAVAKLVGETLTQGDSRQ